MQTIPEEIIFEIVDWLPFEACHPFALTCAHFAEIIACSAEYIAGGYAACNRYSHKGGFDIDFTEIHVYIDKLPNGALHGDVGFHVGGSPRFIIQYVLGEPTYWLAVEENDEYKWGHALSHFYIENTSALTFSGATVRANINSKITIVSYKIAPPQVWVEERDELYIEIVGDYSDKTKSIIDAVDSTLLTSQIEPPKMMVVDGKICLPAVEMWGSRVLNHMRTIHPGVKVTQPGVKLFEGSPSLAKIVLEHCPDLADSDLIYRPTADFANLVGSLVRR